MSAEWYYRRSTGLIDGPLTAAQIKKLADLGEILPETEIKKGADDPWLAARKVKGLFGPSHSRRENSTRLQTPGDSQRPAPAVPRSDTSNLSLPSSRIEGGIHRSTAARPQAQSKKQSPLLLVGLGAIGGLLIVALAFLALSIMENNKGSLALQQLEDRTSESSSSLSVISENPNRSLATSSTPESTIQEYLATSTWEQRLPLILNADRLRPKLANIYRNVQQFKRDDFLPGTIKSVENRNASIGEKCIVTVDVSKSSPDTPSWTYILIRTVDGFKVDWEASQNEAVHDKFRDVNPVIEVEILRCRQSYSRTEFEFRITNKSTTLFSYVAITMSIHNAQGGYLGNSFTNETNVRAGGSVIKSISFDNVTVGEVASWKIGIDGVTIDRGDGRRIDATAAFTLKEQSLGANNGYPQKLESRLAGHWRGERKKWNYYFSSVKPEATLIDGSNSRKDCSVNVIERNYSTGEVQLQLIFSDPNGMGIQETFKIRDASTLSVQWTHACKNDNWMEMTDAMKAEWLDECVLVNKKEAP